VFFFFFKQSLALLTKKILDVIDRTHTKV